LQGALSLSRFIHFDFPSTAPWQGRAKPKSFLKPAARERHFGTGILKPCELVASDKKEVPFVDHRNRDKHEHTDICPHEECEPPLFAF
jgi:hypothetical protein